MRLIMVLCVLGASVVGQVRGASTTLPAGQTLELKEDLVLTGSDNLVVEGTAEKPCTIVGNGHAIKTRGEWAGKLKLVSCTIKGLGAKAKSENGRLAGQFHALDLTAAGKAEIVLENCTFDASSSINIANQGESTTVLRNNVLLENSIVAVNKDIGLSVPAITATGNSPAPKVFQGNRVYRSSCELQSPNWTVGGEKDDQSNLVIGLRAGMFVRGPHCLARNNYVHLIMLEGTPEFPYWSQTSTFSVGKDSVGEYNVIRDGAWIIRFVEGEFRYNVVTDSMDHDTVQNGSIGVFHHNIFLGNDAHHICSGQGGVIALVYPPKNPGDGLEAYNNVFDGCDRMANPGVELSDKTFVKSLRNNVFIRFVQGPRYGIAFNGKFEAGAMVRYAWNEQTPSSPARFGYADYNLFFNPKAEVKDNYALTVAGKTERKDAGFALNDVPKGGDKDAQVDPKFKGPLPTEFPYKDEDIKAGKATVSQILKTFRDAYTPQADSPLLKAGDPADGEGTDIGAVQVSPVKAPTSRPSTASAPAK